jgi:fatty-acyl-CoA synthase
VYQLPQISEAAVIGLPDERWGERPVAVAVLHVGATLDYATLAVHCRSHLAGFKVPKALHLVEALPRNPSGKVLKRVLRERFTA